MRNCSANGEKGFVKHDYDEPPLTFEVASKRATIHLRPPLANLWLTNKFCKKSRRDLLIAAIAITHDYTVKAAQALLNPYCFELKCPFGLPQYLLL
jgi:hypothetical protein